MKQAEAPFEMGALEELGSFLRGRGISRSDLIDSGLPAVLYGDLYTRFDGTISAAKWFVSHETAVGSTEIQYGDILFPTAGETSEEIGKPSVYLSTEQAYAGGDMIIFRPNDPSVSPYVMLALRTHDAYRYRYRMAQGQSIVHINQGNLETHPILFSSNVEGLEISKLLAAWDNAIELTEKLIAAKQKHKQALMQQLFPSSYDPGLFTKHFANEGTIA